MAILSLDVANHCTKHPADNALTTLYLNAFIYVFKKEKTTRNDTGRLVFVSWFDNVAHEDRKAGIGDDEKEKRVIHRNFTGESAITQ